MARGMAVTTTDPETVVGHQRRCLATGAVADTRALIRFVIDPDGQLIPDIAERLPGRGYWVTADADALHLIGRRNLVSRAARRPVRVPLELPTQVTALLLRRSLDVVALARRAGAAVAGYEKCRAWLADGRAGLLLAASDGNADDRARMRGLAAGRPIVVAYTAAELGSVFGRERTVHAVVAPGAFAERVRREAERLAAVRSSAAQAGHDNSQGTTEQA